MFNSAQHKQKLNSTQSNPSQLNSTQPCVFVLCARGRAYTHATILHAHFLLAAYALLSSFHSINPDISSNTWPRCFVVHNTAACHSKQICFWLGDWPLLLLAVCYWQLAVVAFGQLAHNSTPSLNLPNHCVFFFSFLWLMCLPLLAML